MIYKIETNKVSIFIQRETENIELNMPQPMTYIYRFSGPTGKSYIGQTKTSLAGSPSIWMAREASSC